MASTFNAPHSPGADDDPNIVDQTKTSDAFWSMLHIQPQEYSGIAIDELPSDGDYCTYLNSICELVGKNLNEGETSLFFRDTTAPLDHPTAIECRPDLVVHQNDSSDEFVHWSGIEATVQVESQGLAVADSIKQAETYTLLLLQARPDRVTVQGFYVDKQGFVLILSNADGVQRTPRLSWNGQCNLRLLYAFIFRIFKPHPTMTDPTIKRNKPTDLGWTFDITFKKIQSATTNIPSSVTCTGYRIMYSGCPIGHHTQVLKNEHNPTLINGRSIYIIKEQYREEGHSHFSEEEIIREVKHVPGVVRLVHCEDVSDDAGLFVRTPGRHKVRLGMENYGRSLMVLKTPRQTLIAIYDLLEVTRCLYRNCQVLHRDISGTNALIADDSCAANVISADINESIESKAEAIHNSARLDFCSANHLLYPDDEKPQSTSVLLIDFDQGEIRNKEDRDCVENTGSRGFIARALMNSQPLMAYGFFKGMPQVNERYAKILPDRVIQFPPDGNTYICHPPSTFEDQWRHELRHEAESIFWLLFWWAIYALPVGADQLSYIPPEIWVMFQSQDKAARSCLIPDFHEAAVDSLYAPLATLLRAMAGYISVDHWWAKEEHLRHPEFVHEAFQRLIFNFLLEHNGASFMDLPKQAGYRLMQRVRL